MVRAVHLMCGLAAPSLLAMCQLRSSVHHAFQLPPAPSAGGMQIILHRERIAPPRFRNDRRRGSLFGRPRRIPRFFAPDVNEADDVWGGAADATTTPLAADATTSIPAERGQRQIARPIDRRSAISAVGVSWALASSESASASPLLEAPSVLSTDADSDTSGAPDSPIIAQPNPRAITTITVASPRQSAGLELCETKIGTPRRTVVAVLSVRPNGAGANAGAQSGMVLLDFKSVEDVLRRIATGPYPLALQLYNLALGGVALGDLGRSIVAPDDALQLAESVSGDTIGVPGGSEGRQSQEGLAIRVVEKARGACAMKSRRGDTMQIRYEARIGDEHGAVYDSSSFRGTGQPYAYVLGNADVIKGVDLGTYDMCPGEVRELDIPPELGYRGGSKLFKQIPSNSRLFWRVELAELNFVKEGENERPREEVEGRY